MQKESADYLTPTSMIDSDHPSIRDYAIAVAGRSQNPIETAVKLYLAVRDNIIYDPYSPFYLPEHYRASDVLKRGRSFCVPKASLLCALGRACGIPARVGFADVRNHLATKQLIKFMGNDVFVYHGFVELYLEEKWVKSTPAFNIDLCRKHRVPPLEFNGREDSIFQAYNQENQRFMEYIDFHGLYADIPVDEIVVAWEKAYGRDRVRNWVRMLEEGNGRSLSDFAKEEVLNE